MPSQTKAKPKTSKRKATPRRPAVNVVLATFDDRYGMPAYRELRSGKIGEFGPVGFHEYQPLGMTPLLDATAQLIASLDAKRKRAPRSVTIGLLMDESGSMKHNTPAVIQGVNEFVDGMRDVDAVDPESAGKVLAVIVTDGGENASREVTVDHVRKMVREKEESGDWTFIYLGANQDAWAEGSSFGLSGTATGQTVTTSGSVEGTLAAFRNVSGKSKEYLSNNAMYMSLASASPVTTLDESGNEVIGSNPSQPNASVSVGNSNGPWSGSTYGDVSGALGQAKKGTKKKDRRKR